MPIGCLKVPQPATFAVLLASALAPLTLAPTVAAAGTAAAAHDARAKHMHARARKRHPPRRQSPTCPGASMPQVTVSPLPGTPEASPQTQISFLGAAASQLRSIHVIGSRSGRHAGTLRSYAATTGASFVPSEPFQEGERVSVCATVRTGHGRHRVASSFEVAAAASLRYQPPFEAPGTRGDMQTYHSTDVKPPKIAVSHEAGPGSAPGDLFATPYAGPAEHGAMIFAGSGRLIWFHRPPNPNWGIADLRLQSWAGHEDLVWWQGLINSYGFGSGEDVIANSAYEQVGRVKGGNGLAADLHDIQLTPTGAAFIIAYYPVRTGIPLAGAKGLRGGVVLDPVVQEIDVRTGLVMWEWQSLGHVPLAESHLAPSKGGGPYDYLHIDSLQQLPDGDLLICARSAWSAYDVRLHSGRITWRLGGRRSSFRLAAGARFEWPEDMEMLSGEQVAIYDGGSARPTAVAGSPGSAPRGEILSLDFAAQTASLVRGGQLRRAVGAARGAGQGSVQALAGGNWLVGWGGLPNFTEFNHEGGVLYDARFPASEVGYRVYREQWQGQPSTPPNLVASTGGANTTLYASWNGATDVAAWRVLSGPAPSALAVAATAPASGFETAIVTPTAAYVQVQALGSAGEVLSESKTIAAGGA